MYKAHATQKGITIIENKTKKKYYVIKADNSRQMGVFVQENVIPENFVDITEEEFITHAHDFQEFKNLIESKKVQTNGL